MANFNNTIKRLTKKIGQPQSLENGKVTFLHNDHLLTFRANGRHEADVEASCFYTIRDSRVSEDNNNDDYHAGTFHDNATQALNFINRK